MKVLLIKSFSNKPWRSIETYNLIEKSLSKKWLVSSISTQDQEKLHDFIFKEYQLAEGQVFVFNIAEYLDETTKNGFIPALLDEWNIPHLGSKAEVISSGLDKAKTKKMLVEKGIPTPPFFISDGFETDYSSKAEKISYPLFVKPIFEGGHIGIGDHSIVNNAEQLLSEITKIHENYQEPALIEKFIHGKEMHEYSVGIICGNPTLFTPVEIDYETMRVATKILSYESANEDLERIKIVTDSEINNILINLTLKTFEAVGASDYSRVDIRMDDSGYFVLEINVMPGLGPHSFLPEAAESIHGISYERLIQNLTEFSLKRQGFDPDQR
jgi:D-alanine-D-alanine ligase